jgi:site-specific recombinase XerD
VSELIGMKVGDVVLDRSSSIRIHGKGRKERTVPLWSTTANQLRLWLRQNQHALDRPLFPNRTGDPMTRTGVTDRLKLAVATAATRCPQLKRRSISPHIVRHATAMHMLQSGVDITVLALWLGHESPETTHMYVEADLAMKERALNSLQAPAVKKGRFRPTDRVLAFLEGL